MRISDGSSDVCSSDLVSLIGMLRVVFALRSGHFTAFGRTPVRFPPAPALAVSKVDAAGIATRTRRWGLARGGWLGPWDFSPGPPADYPAMSRFPGGDRNSKRLNSSP